jgi:hypothetical protein
VRTMLMRGDSDEAYQRRQDFAVICTASVAIVGTALYFFVNDRVVEHRIMSKLRRSPRLWSGALTDILGFRTPTGHDLIIRALAKLKRRGLISSETGTIYVTARDEYDADYAMEVDMWSLVSNATSG